MPNILDANGRIFPIVSGVRRPTIFALDIFLGTGFWISSKGFFLTCKHVVESLKDSQQAALGLPSEDPSIVVPVVGWQIHPKIDIALGRVQSGERSVFAPFGGQMMQGLEVESFGHMNGAKVGQGLRIERRLLRGHISRIDDCPDGLPANSICEVSFASPTGFSGAPLFAEGKVAGMLFGNIESRLQAFALEEVTNDRGVFKETSYRVLEYGLAHPLADMVNFVRECGIEPFA